MKLVNKTPSCAAKADKQTIRQNAEEKKRGKELKVEEDVSNE
jgi:hypothetical protein